MMQINERTRELQGENRKTCCHLNVSDKRPTLSKSTQNSQDTSVFRVHWLSLEMSHTRSTGNALVTRICNIPMLLE